MIILASLSFETSALALLFSILVLVSVVVLAFIAMHRSFYRRPIVILESMRIGIVSLVLLVLNQPEQLRQFIPEEKPTIAVLWDDSGSMQTKDISADGTANGS